MATPLRVLILEDYAPDAELMLHELRRADFHPDWLRVDTEEGFRAQLDAGWDVILADYSLPQFDAMRALKILRAREPDTPFVIVTASISEEVAVECMKQGASDYLLKDRLGRLGPAVQRALEDRQLREERRLAAEAREQLAREQAARAVAEAAQQRITSILESITDAFYAVDREWRFTYLNQEAERVVQRRGADLIGKVIWDELPYLVGTSFEREYRRAVAENVAVSFEGHYPAHDRWYEARAYPTPDGLSIYSRDVTEKKLAEREREAMLAREQALRAEAQDAVRQRNDLLAMVSHDLKNPLARIKGYAQLLLRQLVGEDPVDVVRLQQGLTQIETTAATMNAQINQLVDLTRLQLGETLQLDRRPTDLVDLARRVADGHQKTTERHRLVMTPLVPELVGSWDTDRLERAFGNLIENAIKYSPEGGTITVSVTHHADGDGSWAILSVCDEGIGIPQADLSRIFERFHRGSNVVAQIPGTGLGLAGVRQIVEQHGGTIAVESAEGAGSAFTIRLPIDR